MVRKIEVFPNEVVTVYTTPQDGVNWFCLKDICKVLGVEEDDALENVEIGDIEYIEIPTAEGMEVVDFVNIDGVHAIGLLGSQSDAVELEDRIEEETGEVFDIQ